MIRAWRRLLAWLTGRDPWLANLEYYARLEMRRGLDQPCWPLAADRQRRGGSWGAPGSRVED